MSSICSISYRLKEAAWVAPAIVAGTLLEKGSFRYPGSPQFPAHPEGADFSFLRIRAQRTLKGPQVRVGEELRVFSGMQWFHHTHDEELRHNIISYADPHYGDAPALDQIEIGSEILVYLRSDPVPPEFPPGAVFQAFGEAYDRGGRADEVLAMLQEDPEGDFGREIRLQAGRRVRFPDGLEIVFLSHSQQSSEEEGPKRQWIDVGLAKDDYRGTMPLSYGIDADGKETRQSQRWHGYTVDLIAIRDGEPVIVVRKTP